jgi:hypothetical protein
MRGDAFGILVVDIILVKGPDDFCLSSFSAISKYCDLTGSGDLFSD